MIARIPKSRIGINFAILLFLTAGLNGCLGSSDGVDVNEERVPIVLALDSNLESASGIFDDPLLSTFESSLDYPWVLTLWILRPQRLRH